LILLGTDDPHLDFVPVKQNVLPFDRKGRGLDALPEFVRKVLTTEMLRRRLRAVQDEDPVTRALIGDSPAMRTAKGLVKRVATSRASTVLLQGETGTGKDLCAEILHNLSDRAAKPFFVITCSALPEHLLESELFGHERGAFTDARERKLGLFELAKGGTVFLDEIGEMTMPLQAKLLRFLEHKAFRRVGGLQDIEVDVRIVAATHRNLQERVRSVKRVTPSCRSTVPNASRSSAVNSSFDSRAIGRKVNRKARLHGRSSGRPGVESCAYPEGPPVRCTLYRCGSGFIVSSWNPTIRALRHASPAPAPPDLRLSPGPRSPASS
jgi:hypothetical protein